MKHLRESILSMPVWKAGVLILFIIFGLSVGLEVILSHTVFQIFDRMITKFEIEKKEDLSDLNAMDQLEQKEFCSQYKWLLQEKKDLAKKSPSEFSYDFDENVMRSHEEDINFAIKNHHFKLEQCKAELKGENA